MSDVLGWPKRVCSCELVIMAFVLTRTIKSTRRRINHHRLRRSSMSMLRGRNTINRNMIYICHKSIKISWSPFRNASIFHANMKFWNEHFCSQLGFQAGIIHCGWYVSQWVVSTENGRYFYRNFTTPFYNKYYKNVEMAEMAFHFCICQSLCSFWLTARQMNTTHKSMCIWQPLHACKIGQFIIQNVTSFFPF